MIFKENHQLSLSDHKLFGKELYLIHEKLMTASNQTGINDAMMYFRAIKSVIELKKHMESLLIHEHLFEDLDLHLYYNGGIPDNESET